MNIIITGGSSGIGKCLRKIFEKRGDTVHNFSRTNNLDVTNHLIVRDYIKKNIEKVDLLIHCAGYNKPTSVSGICNSYNDWEKHFQVNYLSFVYLISFLHSQNKIKDGATVVALSSRSASLTRKDWSGYCSSKAALNSFIKNYAVEYPQNRIIGISPSKVYTPMIKELYPDIQEKDCWDPRNLSSEIIKIMENDDRNGVIHELIHQFF